MRPPRHRPGPQSGVALLIVLVVLFIVAVLMVDISLTATTARRSAQNLSGDFLMDAAIEGRYQVAVAQLRYDLAENKTDSPDDRWAREEYTSFESTTPADGTEAKEKKAREEEGGLRLLGDSDEVSVKVTIEDEERKFNLNLLVHPDPAQRKKARERFATLLDRFREDTPLDISATKAEELRDRVVEYLERSAPSEGDQDRVPVPKSGPWRLLTPDELRYAEGFEDSTHRLTAEGILYDARDPEAEAAFEADPGNVEPPDVYPGLLRYVTLWSGSAWIPALEKDKLTAEIAATFLRINLNTAEKPVLETLFQEGDMHFAQKIIEYRGTEKEGSTADDGEAPGADEPLATHQYFEKFADLSKVEGLDSAVIERNKATLNEAVCVFRSETFSLGFLAEREEAVKQVRFVVRRNAEGVQTLLREERADPQYERKDEEARRGASAE